MERVNIGSTGGSDNYRENNPQLSLAWVSKPSMRMSSTKNNQTINCCSLQSYESSASVFAVYMQPFHFV
jgi:hypothetical protein